MSAMYMFQTLTDAL